MPKWTHNIPDDPRGPSFPIRRTPAYSKLVAIVTSEDLLGTFTHYYKGRTQPCELPNCEPHREGIPFRWHAYFTCLDQSNALHFIFEVTATGAEPFIDYRDNHGTLRGCLFQATRWKNRPNGRILVQTKPADLTKLSLPRAPDLAKCLAILWNYHDGHVQQKRPNPEKRTPRAELKLDTGNGN